ncbi:MAG: sigma-70 family RNA polymerase sigma factor [Deltaproteobacteria bacterium]|nr:sigma-70 family RNA polymerase sigma factor [Deltaproteobacteria bacterium]
MDAVERQALQRNLTALADGDRTAFPPVFRALWPALRAFAGHWLRDESLAEDAAQSALLKVFARAGEFDPARDALAWSFGVCVWECRTLRKSGQRRREEPLGDEALSLSDPARSPHDDVELAQLIEAIESVAGTLRPDDRALVLLLARGDRPESASATFRKRVQRALDRLRCAWRLRHGND